MNSGSTAFSGSIPELYEHHLGPLLFEPFALDLVARLHPETIAAALEIACGTGRVTRHLQRVLPPPTPLVATDINADMMAVAQTALADRGITWQVADAQSLPFPDASFDLVVCQFGLMFVPDKAKACREAFRVLRPGGRFLFNTWDKLENNPVSFVANSLIATYFLPDPPPFFPIPFSMHDKTTLHDLLQGCGFQDITVKLTEKEGRSESAMSAAIGFVDGNPIATILRQRNPAMVPEIREAVRQTLAEQFGESPLITPLRAWVAEGRK